MQAEGAEEAQKRAAPHRAPGTVENRQKGGWEEGRNCKPSWWDGNEECQATGVLEQVGLGV